MRSKDEAQDWLTPGEEDCEELTINTDNGDAFICPPSPEGTEGYGVTWSDENSVHEGENVSLTSSYGSSGSDSGKDSPFSSSSSTSACYYISGNSGTKRSAWESVGGGNLMNSREGDNDDFLAQQVECLRHEDKKLRKHVSSVTSLPSFDTLSDCTEIGTQLVADPKDPTTPLDMGFSAMIDPMHSFAQTRAEQSLQDVFPNCELPCHPRNAVTVGTNIDGGSVHAASSSSSRLPPSCGTVEALLEVEAMAMNQLQRKMNFFLAKERQMAAASAALGLSRSKVDQLLTETNPSSSLSNPCFSPTGTTGNQTSAWAFMDRRGSIGSANTTGTHPYENTRSTCSRDVVSGDDWRCDEIAKEHCQPPQHDQTGDCSHDRSSEYAGTTLAECRKRFFVCQPITDVATQDENLMLHCLETFCNHASTENERETAALQDTHHICDVSVEVEQTNMDTKDSKFISESDIRPQDVLFGRGGFTIHYKGNVHYRKLVAERVHSYMKKVRKHHKTSLSEEVVRAVIVGGGRFLKKCSKGDVSLKTDSPERHETDETDDNGSKDEGNSTTGDATDERCWMVLNVLQARKKVSQRFREEAADLEDAGLHSWVKQTKQSSRKRLRHTSKCATPAKGPS